MEEHASTYFTDTGHLTELAFAKVAEEVAKDKLVDLPTELRHHLDHCSKCRHEVAELYQIVRVIDSDEPSTKPKNWQSLVWISSLLLLTILLYKLWPSPKVPVSTIEVKPYINEEIGPARNDTFEIPRDTIEADTPPPTDNRPKERPDPPAEKSPVYASAYVPNEALDPLVGQQIRAGSVLSFQPKLDRSFEQGEKIRFSWSSELIGPFQLTILDNAGEQRVSYSGTDHQWEQAADLSPGLYYWKLETEEDLLFVGKFTILLP